MCGASIGNYQRMRILLLLVLSIIAYMVHSLSFRTATPQDVAFAKSTMLKNAMNPLSISQANLLVATKDSTVVGFGQVRELDERYCELASLFVLPEYRRHGVGTAIVEALLKRHDAAAAANRDVCLLTLKPTVLFYEPHGFRIVGDISMMPKTIQVEFAAGNLVSLLLGNDLVCMVRSSSKSE